MKKTFFLLFSIALILFIVACSSEKTYQYILVIKAKDKKIEQKQEIIRAKNDSAAYIIVSKKYVESYKNSFKTIDREGELTVSPTGYKLINKQGVDISKKIKYPLNDLPGAPTIEILPAKGK